MKLITNINYSVDLAKLSDKKLLYNFAKEMYFDERTPGNKNSRNGSLIRLLKPHAIMASGKSTIFSPRNPSELCNRIKLLLKEKQDGKISTINDEESIAIADEFLEYKCISTKEHKNLLVK